MSKSPEENLPTILDPALPIPLASATYDGFGQALSSLAAAASMGMKISLPPLYIASVIVASIYAYIKVREAQNRVALRRELILARKQRHPMDSLRLYWLAAAPSFIDNGQQKDLREVLAEHSSFEMASLLGNYYRQISYTKAKIQSSESLSNEEKRQFLKTMETVAKQFAAESSQFKHPALTLVLNKACGEPITPPPDRLQVSFWRKLWNNLRKYYKSILTGGSTAGGLTVMIVETALSNATLTMLFPWSIGIIIGAIILGGVMGYFIDKHLDRKHKIGLQEEARKSLDAKNKKRLGFLWAGITQLISKIEQKFSNFFNFNEEASFPTELELNDLELDDQNNLNLYPEVDYLEVEKLKAESHFKRKVADFILPTLLAVRAAFGAVSTVFAGLAFAGLVLPWWPVLIIGGVMLSIFVVFKIVNNWIKHRSEEEAIERLNTSISAEKFSYWAHCLDFPEVAFYVKKNESQTLLNDLEKQYTDFKQVLETAKNYQDQNFYSELESELRSIHYRLLLCYQAHADAIKNKETMKELYGLSMAPPPAETRTENLIYPSHAIWTILYKVDNFVVKNFKDIIQGFGFGFGTSVTVLVFMGLGGSLLTLWPIVAICAASLVGIAIKVGIRYAIKALRNQRLKDITTLGQDTIFDKEELMDCQAATALASKEAKDLVQGIASRKMVEKTDKETLPLKRPLLLIESFGKEAKLEEELQNSKYAPIINHDASFVF